ncbi:MAG: hypothetical protein IPO57_15885 [Rhodocyclales bacterium]|nr:hypothetical protein [Rhodocyclales bacterium]
MDESRPPTLTRKRARFFERPAERQHDATMPISSHRLNEVSLAGRSRRRRWLWAGVVRLTTASPDDAPASGALDCRIRGWRSEPVFAKALITA